MNLSQAILRFDPSPPLARIVSHYEWTSIDSNVQTRELHVTPSFGLGIIFRFENKGALVARTSYLGEVDVPECFVFSPLDVPAHIQQLGRFAFLRVVFKPGMMSTLFDRVSLSSFKNQVLDPRLHLDRGMASLYERMQASERGLPRVRLLDDYLLDKLRWKSIPTSLLGEVTAELARQSCRRVTVESVADHLGISRQHLSRVSKRQLGFSAHQMLRVLRYNRTIVHFHTTQLYSLAQSAACLGYADQAHMTHEFRRCTETTPGAYLRKLATHVVYGQVAEFSGSGMLAV